MSKLCLKKRFLLPAALLIVIGCSHTHSLDTSKFLHVPMLASPTTFDPAMVSDGTTNELIQQFYEGLVRWTPQNTVAPALATRWDISTDGRTYTFHLRPGVTFQDGSAFGAQDVYYSLRRALDPQVKSVVALTYLGDIVGADAVNKGTATELSGVKVIDSQTVAITIKQPKAYWIDTLTYPTAFIVSQAEAGKVAGPLTEQEAILGAGTGPFRLTSYDKDSRLIMTANAKYWDGTPTLPGQDRPIVIDAGTRHALYMDGKLDIVDEPKSTLEADEADPAVKGQIRYWPRASTFYLALNSGAFAPFKDVRVRQALACAIDKQKIRHIALKDQLDIAEDILPEGIPGYNPKFRGLAFDPDRARLLLAAAGYPGGKGFPTLPITYRQSYPELDQISDMIRDSWQNVLGIHAQTSRTEWTTLLDQENKNELSCCLIRWSADYLDPQDYYSTLLHTGNSENHVAYSNITFDALCDKADTSLDFTKRTALYRQAARIIADEVPFIPLYYQKDIELVKPNVSGISDCLMGRLPYTKLIIRR